MLSLLQSYFRGKSLRIRFRPVNSHKVVSRTCLCHYAAVVLMELKKDVWN